MSERNEPLVTWRTTAYLATGIWLVHTLHVCRFLLASWDRISALPDWQIGTKTAFWLGFFLIPLAIGGASTIRQWPRIQTLAIVALVCEIYSQAIGRSLFTLIGDLGLWGVVLGAYFVRRQYGLQVVATLSISSLGAFHSEALGMLRTIVNLCLFVIGTLGIAVTSNVISQYFGTDLGQGTAWVQVGSMLYLALGMSTLMVWPLMQSVIAARQRIGERD